VKYEKKWDVGKEWDVDWKKTRLKPVL